ncbi:hypothetical protein HID58_041741 [Brassica napus]|uniref:Uncharacterized protein n=1 Tax=Brassica napus TaxID=3708 RepID=A0ABQ8BC13_BRANA|nr:hypothetical protein HID58_041741 [Brassica napus]
MALKTTVPANATAAQTRKKAPQVYSEADTLRNLKSRLAKGLIIKCSKCNLKGDAFVCYIRSCRHCASRAEPLPKLYWNPSVTHVLASKDVKGACTRTVNVIMDILNGKGIINAYFSKLLKAIDEEPFDIHVATQRSQNGPKTAKLKVATNLTSHYLSRPKSSGLRSDASMCLSQHDSAKLIGDIMLHHHFEEFRTNEVVRIM